MTKKHLSKWVAIPLLTTLAFTGVGPVVQNVPTAYAASSLQTQANQYASELVTFFNGLDAHYDKIAKAKKTSNVGAYRKAVADAETYLYKQYVPASEIEKKYGKELGLIHLKMDAFKDSAEFALGAISMTYNQSISLERLAEITRIETEKSFGLGVQHAELLTKFIEKNKIKASRDLHFLAYGTELDGTKNYTVKKGDTLYGVAKANKTTVAAIKKLNSLKNDQLSIGQKLLVKGNNAVVTPPKEEAKPVVTKPVVSKTAKVTASVLNIRSGASTKDKVVGSVKKGNTVKVISVSGKWVKVSFGKVTGYIHSDYVKLDPTPTTPKPTTPVTPVAKSHTVQKGDTLYSISKKYNVTVSTLKSLNGLKADTIQLGKKLIIKK